MRRTFGHLIFLYLILTIIACEYEVQSEMDPELETGIDTVQSPTLDTMMISVDSEAFKVSRYNAIRRADPVPDFYFDLFIAEDEDSARFEIYYGTFSPTYNFAYHFQKCNYIDHSGVYYTNGRVIDFGRLLTSIPEKNTDRFFGTFKTGR